MPIYEFACKRCEVRFEELVSASEQKVVCPECGSKKVERRFSQFATEWKPSIVNWHRFPYRRGGW
jgi:putative FmdB family regulatory protein